MNSQPTILYVEDEARSRRVMNMMLVKSMKLPHVTIFEDSTDFLARAEALDPKPDLIFLDIHVAPYSGFEMLKMLRGSEKFAKTIVIALTASVMNEEVQQLRTSGFNGCLAKPIDSDKFPDFIAEIMRGEEIWSITS
jgi:two-component system, OmpR family, sensor histidine kinase TorS